MPAPRLRQLDRAQRVEQTGALVLGGDTEIGRAAEEDLTDGGRRRLVVVVRLAIRLDDERRGSRRERGRLARAAEVYEADRAAADRVLAVGVGRDVGRARGPVQVAGGDEVRHSPVLGDAGAGERRDLVVEPAEGALPQA